MADTDPPLAWAPPEVTADELRRRYPLDAGPYRTPGRLPFLQPRVYFDGLPYPQRLTWLEETDDG